MLSKLITPEQVSEQLGVTVGTLQLWRCTGRYNLPYVKAGRLVRYRQSDIDHFIDSRVQEHTGSDTREPTQT